MSLGLDVDPESDHVVPRPRSVMQTAFLSPEVVLLDDDSGRVYQLNPSASAIWLLIDGRHSAADLAGELAEITGMSAEQLIVDVQAAVRDFRERGFLEGDRNPTGDLAAPPRPMRTALPPPEPCGSARDRPTWAGVKTVVVDDTVVAVGYDGERSSVALDRALAGLSSTDAPEAGAAFGVRAVRAGVRRREGLARSPRYFDQASVRRPRRGGDSRAGAGRERGCSPARAPGSGRPTGVRS